MAMPNEEASKIIFGSNFSSGLDITCDKDGGVLKTVLRHGIGEEHPLNGDTVYLHYMGHFEDGTVFDSSRAGNEKFQFVMGNGEVIKAWEIGIQTMRRNEVAVFYCKPSYAYGKEGKSPKIPSDAILVYEIELISWRGEDVSLKKDGGVLKSRLKDGTGNPPKDGAIVEIFLIGQCDGKKFIERDAKFTLGEGCEISIVDGVEEALKSMKSGEQAKLKVQSRYGFGSEGHERYGVPSNADLEYEVHLKSYFPFKEGWMMDDEERIGEAAKMKMKGAKCFKDGKYKFAAKHFSRVIEFLIEEDHLRGKEAYQRNFLMLAAHLNIALCNLKLGENLEATHACDEALKIDPQNEKAFYRRALAHLELGNFEEAISDFRMVLQVNPKNKVAEEKIEVATQKLKELRQKEKSICSQMFKKKGDKETTHVDQQQKSKSEQIHNSDNGETDGGDAVEHTNLESATLETDINARDDEVTIGKSSPVISS